jgi:hypothetical protein
VAPGENDAVFDSDLEPLAPDEVQRLVLRLGGLRARLLERIRSAPAAALDLSAAGEFTVRQALEELARGTWWTLSRLGASPVARLPDDLPGRLDTAMALAVNALVNLPEDRGPLQLDDEVWTPRKVFRRLLWLEWSVGRVVERALSRHGDGREGSAP